MIHSINNISLSTEASPDDPKPRLVEDVTKDLEKANEFDIWGPVGGLEDVKQELTECIFWPIMVNIFSSYIERFVERSLRSSFVIQQAYGDCVFSTSDIF